MRANPIALTVSLLASLWFAAPGVFAEHHHEHHHHEHRQHGAHVHGVATLNLALEGREAHIELHGPAANFIGFEHAPASAADHAALDRAVALLRDGDDLFRFNAEAGCRMEHVRLASPLLTDAHHHDAGHKDAHEHGNEHAHTGHDAHEGETHADMEADYHFECTAPGRLTRLTIELFEAFPGMETLQTQYVLAARQGAVELTATQRVIRF